MARIWTEPFDPKRHRDFMPGVKGVPKDEFYRAPTLQRYPVYFVRVAGFKFEFHGLDQVRECLKFFSKKTRPSGRTHLSKEELIFKPMHWETERWFEKIPMKLLEERRRVEIVEILTLALAHFRSARGSKPSILKRQAATL